MGKAAAKQARTLELEFTLAPRPRPERGGGGGGGGGRPGQRGRAPRDDDHHLLGAAGPAHDDFAGAGAAALAPSAAAAPRTHCPDEFPTLSGAPAPPAPAAARPNGVGGLTIRAVRQPPLAVTDENFPALGGADAAPPPAALNTVRLSVNSERAGDGLSIRVNRRADPHATRLRADDFPSLGASSGPPAAAPPPASSVASGQWLHVDRRGRPRTPLAGPPQGPPPKVKSLQEDFPSLGAPASASEPRAKKASSVVIPVTPAPSWLQSNGPVHPPAAAPAPAAPAPAKQELMGVATIKVKSKKKKQQQQPQQQQQAKNANDGGGKEAGKRKKREDAAGSATSLASASSKSAARSGEEEITSKLEGVLTCKESSSGGGGDGRGAGHSSSSSTGSGAASAAAAAAERKRSELLIASLRPERTAPPPSPPESPPPPAIPREDFPSLGCPPGFWRPVLAAAAAASTAPPPGFGAAPATTTTTTSSSSTSTTSAAAAAGPPPGFSSVTLNSVARAPAPPGGNGLTFTSSSGRSYPILPRAAPAAGALTPSPAPAAAAAAPFVPPRDAERRNQALVARVRRAVPLDDFLQLSALYRQGALPAATFRSHCRHLLGEEAFADVFPELLALLPDIAKQQELMAAHEEEEGPGSLPIQVCASCGQVLASGDLRHHQASHRLENHFASTTLDKASTTVASAWDSRK